MWLQFNSSVFKLSGSLLGLNEIPLHANELAVPAATYAIYFMCYFNEAETCWIRFSDFLLWLIIKNKHV